MTFSRSWLSASPLSKASLRARPRSSFGFPCRGHLRPSSSAAHSQPIQPAEPTNPALTFPCLDRLEQRTAFLASQQPSSPASTPLPPRTSSLAGPEPSYTSGVHQTFTDREAALLDWGGILPEYTIAYETWGTLNHDRSNAILLHTGLSASSHAAETAENSQPGWWDRFIGPGKALDTNRFFVICTNVVGGCYGSTGPRSIDPADGQPYATRFPIVTVDDMVRLQFRLVDSLGIDRLHASVGSSLGGMQSLAAAVAFPDRVGRVVTVSGCARTHPSGIAMRHAQRQVLMMDPNWARGFYYNSVPPHAGMKLAREIATVTYRSGPEWELRFGRRRADPSRPPALCPDFLIETYLDHAGEKWCLEYDANSFLYVSKAMDLFDLGAENRSAVRSLRLQNQSKLDRRRHQAVSRSSVTDSTDGKTNQGEEDDTVCPLTTLTLPDQPYEEVPENDTGPTLHSQQTTSAPSLQQHSPPASSAGINDDLVVGLGPMRNTPALVLGVQSDILFPAPLQREIADSLRAAGNNQVAHIELSTAQSHYGHDTFLLDVDRVGGSIKLFLES